MLKTTIYNDGAVCTGDYRTYKGLIVPIELMGTESEVLSYVHALQHSDDDNEVQHTVTRTLTLGFKRPVQTNPLMDVWRTV